MVTDVLQHAASLASHLDLILQP